MNASYRILVSFLAFANIVFASPTRRTAPPTAREDTNASPFYLNIYNPHRQTFAPEYLTSTGSVSATTGQATLFKLTNDGGLSTVSTQENFVILRLSTDKNSSVMPWQMGPALQGISDGFRLTSTSSDQVLEWDNEQFETGKARFCQAGSEVMIVFRGKEPEDCELVDLIAVRLE